ncbi:Fc.00g051950.m01.CDS01 [Cosmosporella sp. VM-42]
MSDQVMDAYWRAPPMARTAASITFGVSLGILLGIIPGGWFVHHPYYLWKFPPDIWRPVASFIPAGAGLSLLFDTYFLYNYMSQLEVGHPRFPRKGDLLWYLIFVSGSILTIDYFVGFNFGHYLSALVLAMVYTVTQDQRGARATFYFITIPAQLTPYCMILVNLLFPGGYIKMLLELEGLIAAHLYDFLSRIYPEFGGGPNLMSTPNWVLRLLQTPRVIERNFGAAIRPPDQAAGSSTGASRGPLPDSWRTRGRGQRLG